MGYRGTAIPASAAEVRVPRHSRGSIVIVTVVAVVALAALAIFDFRAVRIACVFDAPNELSGHCAFTRWVGLRSSRQSAAFFALSLYERPEDERGGYELTQLEGGTSFVFGPVANTAAIESMRAAIDHIGHAEPGAVRSNATVGGFFLNRRSAWVAWICGVCAIAIVTFALRRLTRATVVRIAADGYELRWSDESGHEQALPLHVIRAVDVDNTSEGTTLVATVANERVPIARGESRAVLDACRFLEQRVVAGSAGPEPFEEIVPAA